MLRAIVNLDPYTFADDLADDLAGETQNEQRTVEEVLLSTIDTLTADGLTGFTIRLALVGHRGIPREGEFDFLAEAESAFAPPPPKKKAAKKKGKQPTPIEPHAGANVKAKGRKATPNKKVAA